MEAIDYLKRKQNRNNENENNSGKNVQQAVKLPRIELTPFSGLYEDWTTFKDLYTTLIHDEKGISNVQKLHYLKTNVEGDAYSLLKTINITEANYAGAWKKLMDRYEHKRYIVDSLLKSFFNLQSVDIESFEEIKSLSDKSSEIVQGLQVQGIPVDQWDTVLIYVIVSKLECETHKQWELRLKKDELPKFSDLQEFLESRWQSLEMISNNHFSNNRTSTSRTKTVETIALKRSNSNVQSQVKGCVCCSSIDHMVQVCPRYKKLDLESRLQLIRSLRLCFNCLKVGHSLKNYRNKDTCQQCGKNHHTSIHSENKTHLATNEQMPRPRKMVLLATAVVHIFSTTGEAITIKALIDQGSENAIIKSSLAKRLGLVRLPYFSNVKGIGDIAVESEPVLFSFRIGSCVIPSFSMDVEAISMEKITGTLPLVPIEKEPWPHLQGLKLADKNFDCPSNIELLLGAEAYENIILNGVVKKIDNSPTAQNTQLGWLLFGAVKSQNNLELKSNHTFLSRADIDNRLDETLRSFWEIEEIKNKKALTVKESQAESMFAKTVTRTNEGRYSVSLPFDPAKEDRVLGDSRSTAVSCLIQMEKRFMKNKLLEQRYTEYMRNLLEAGHMELVPKERLKLPASDVFYLPHHAVLKESSTTTKLRVVFDASRKSSTGVSLNEKLLVGPRIQDELYSILIRWRKHEFCFIADAEKMFRQIKLNANHRDFQRIVWRFNSKQPITEYRITTVIDGTASAPFLATRTLHQLADDVKKKTPDVAKVLKEDFYMDDVSSGSHSIESTIELRDDLIKTMKQGGFLLRKWLSNNQKVLENIPMENRGDTSALVEIMDESVKTLGVYWNPKNDCFEFNISKISTSEQRSKRQLLSEISKLFDPIGWLAPVTVVAKIFMQSLWSLK